MALLRLCEGPMIQTMKVLYRLSMKTLEIPDSCVKKEQGKVARCVCMPAELLTKPLCYY
jgi:hypothetical protein